ncbi:MAG: PQQ-binding-like beta-propeller repeat protein, partial [Clostridiaceae bacterium]|nr:PQQ-binding-like beta-propeller repeat protein [Clostridiaceae bacterium]
MSRRYRQRKNIAKPLLVILISAVAVLILLAVQGKLPLTGNGGWSASSPTPDPGSPTPVPSESSEPEPTLTPEPTPTPEITDPAKLILDIEAPSFVSKTAVGNGTYQKKFKDGATITYSVFKGSSAIDYKPDYPLAFASDKAYTDVEGVTTFRGNNYRNTAAYGTRDIKERKLEIIWEQQTGAISAMGSYWPGSGWTGQPLLVKWPENVRKIMNINDEFKHRDFVEVIYPILDGNIYFLDLETGKATRPKINLGFSIKGTGAIDPRGYPLLYTGMGINSNDTAGTKTSFKYRIYNLINQTELFTFPGNDPVAYRNWGALDSSGVINWQTDTLVQAGENGLIYKIKLNTRFDEETGTISMSPDIVKYRYKSSYNPSSDAQGIEGSPAFYRNLMFFVDNGGTLQCLDIHKMEPVWIYNVGDDTDSTVVLEETEDGVFLYTANEVDRRCANGKGTKAPTNIRKFNAITGELIWQYDIDAYYRYYINGGVMGTPLIGKDDIADRIIFPVCFTGSQLDGKLIALDKETGKEIWVRDLEHYSWSSPVAIKSEDGKTYGIFCDYGGYMHLFDPMTGEDYDKISLQGNIESS